MNSVNLRQSMPVGLTPSKMNISKSIFRENPIHPSYRSSATKSSRNKDAGTAGTTGDLEGERSK